MGPKKYKNMNTEQKLNELNGLNALNQAEEIPNPKTQNPTPMNREQDESQAPNANAGRERDQAEGEAAAASNSPEDLQGKHRTGHIEHRAWGLGPGNESELLDWLERAPRRGGILPQWVVGT